MGAKTGEAEIMDDLEQMRMTYEFLEQITGDFSTEIGRGKFGVVYKVSLPVHCNSMKIISAAFNNCTNCVYLLFFSIQNMTTVIMCATKVYYE